MKKIGMAIMKVGVGLLVSCVLLSAGQKGTQQEDKQPQKPTQEQQQRQIPTAAQSDPKNFGWMKGFPPAKDRRLKVSDGSFYTFPAFRYTFVHMRQFFPTANVARNNEVPTHKFKYALDKKIDAVTFPPMGGDKRMTWKESLAGNYADGIIVLHKGKVVYEDYFGELTPNGIHGVMSCTKSFTGLLASVLVAEGKLNTAALVTDYVPELKGSAFEGATVQQVLDMTVAMQFNEDYTNPKAEIWMYGAAGSTMPRPAGYKGPDGYFEYLTTVKKADYAHGTQFAYKTVNTDAAAWVMSMITNKNTSDLLSERIWSKLGMEQDACYQIDGLGTPFAGGGLSASLRDLARFGEMMRNKGKWQGEQVIPKAAVENIMKGGDKAHFAKAGYKTLPGWSYKNMWWISHNKHQAIAARGIHGQAIYIDPVAEMVIVRVASNPMPSNGMNDLISLPAYHAVATYLMNK